MESSALCCVSSRSRSHCRLNFTLTSPAIVCGLESAEWRNRGCTAASWGEPELAERRKRTTETPSRGRIRTETSFVETARIAQRLRSCLRFGSRRESRRRLRLPLAAAAPRENISVTSTCINRTRGDTKPRERDERDSAVRLGRTLMLPFAAIKATLLSKLQTVPRSAVSGSAPMDLRALWRNPLGRSSRRKSRPGERLCPGKNHLSRWSRPG